MDEKNDQKLIRECMDGIRASQELLYKKYCRKMAGVCFRYATNKEEAEDFLQDAFIRVFRNLHQYKATGSLEGWIRRIVINTVLDNMRKKSLMFKVVDLEEAERELQPDHFLQEISREELVGLIQELTPGCRAVFNLYAIEGYTHKEIATMLGIRTGTSKSHYFNARRILREKISGILKEIHAK